jgi:hypothetical protein
VVEQEGQSNALEHEARSQPQVEMRSASPRNHVISGQTTTSGPGTLRNTMMVSRHRHDPSFSQVEIDSNQLSPMPAAGKYHLKPCITIKDHIGGVRIENK